MATDEQIKSDGQAELRLEIVKQAANDSAQGIEPHGLKAALGHLTGAYVPFGENDVLAIPIPDGERPIKVALEYEGPTTRLYLLSERSGPDDRVLSWRSLDWQDTEWFEEESGAIVDFAVLGDATCAKRQPDGRVCIEWGDHLVEIPNNATWWLAKDPRDYPILRVMHNGKLTTHFVTGPEPSIDVSNIIPPQAALDASAWHVVLYEGQYFLDNKNDHARLVGNAETTCVFACGHELIALDARDRSRNLPARFRTIADSNGPVASQHSVDADDTFDTSRIVGMYATDLHLIAVHGSVARGTSRATGVIVYNRDGSLLLDDLDHDLSSKGWRETGKVTASYPGIGSRVVVAQTIHEKTDGRSEEGVTVYTDNGHAFFPLRGAAFDSLQIDASESCLYAWRPTPGGIILSRFPLP